MKNSNRAKRINPQPIKLKRRTPTCFTYLPTKEAVNAPATPQSPSIPITSLLAKNGACPILKSQTGPHGEEGTEIQCRPDRINAQLRVFFH